MEFSERVLQARKAKGMSQEKLAELVGVSRQAVSKWETGEAKPDVDKLIAICETLELRMDYLCFGKQDEPCKQELHSTENAEQEQKKQSQNKNDRLEKSVFFQYQHQRANLPEIYAVTIGV